MEQSNNSIEHQKTSIFSGRNIYDNANVSVKVLNVLILGGAAVIFLLMIVL